MKKHLIRLILTVFIVNILLIAGTDGTIRGKVTDLEGVPLPGAQVYIESLSLGTMADLQGSYIILNIPVGTYDITVGMMGYQRQIMSNVDVMMDKTLWLNFSLPQEAIEGKTVVVSGRKDLIEKGETAKNITVSKEAIEALPIRDITELYLLQSGVVKVESRTQGIPDHEERGLEEIHVRGGRAGEIAYMIDGLYIRNPIFGGIGNGTRLNLFAVKEFDWQPGGFNAEYGDAMSAVSNMHTNSGTDNFSIKFRHETSMMGELLGSRYDELRGYDDYVVGFGGKIPGVNKLYYWVSGQYTNKDNYRVYKFDDIVYEENDPMNQQNMENLAQPWDNVKGFRGFGFDKTWDVFGKLSYSPTAKMRFNLSYWTVGAHRKGFNQRYLYWDEGQNELFRDTDRYTIEFNHSLTSRTFYTVRASHFVQDQFQGVRWEDSDSDGYPDWFEWRNPAGPGQSSSDPYDASIVPYMLSENGDTVFYTMRDERTGWYYGAKPGEYNWEAAENFTDVNHNSVWDQGEPFDDGSNSGVIDGVWNGPESTGSSKYRDNSYWLTPEMYEDYTPFLDYNFDRTQNFLDPYIDHYGPFPDEFNQSWIQWFSSNYYYGWNENSAFGGNDRFYGTSSAVTNEFRVDATSQVTDLWKIRTGFDYKLHSLNFFEVKNPWEGSAAFTQSFAEFFLDTGPDGLLPPDADYPGPDVGEGNHKWDEGESFEDANKNSKWDDFREPEELSLYIQNIYEVPWMVINAGIRVDMVNYNTQIWADTLGNTSPNLPWYYADLNENGKRDPSEAVSSSPGFAHQRVLFTDANWFSKISPRLGFSHVITDQATFTFNYGIYYQTPIYQNVYLNTNRLEDPETLFEESEGVLGNATMNASRTQQYEFGFNIQVNRNWAFQLAGWVRDMDQLSTTKSYRSGVYSYEVFSNGDYGSAKGFDFTLENRGMLINTLLQYTYSVAKANSEYDWAAIGSEARDAPSQEFLMPFDRTHDLTLTLYTRLPYNINTSLTGFYQSGAPYTPMIWNGDKPEADLKNKYTKRAPAYKNINISFSKYVQISNYRLALGLNVFNLFDIKNAIDIWPLTGEPDNPGEYYLKDVGLPDDEHDKSGSFYDMPWFYNSPREINFFVQIDFS